MFCFSPKQNWKTEDGGAQVVAKYDLHAGEGQCGSKWEFGAVLEEGCRLDIAGASGRRWRSVISMILVFWSMLLRGGTITTMHKVRLDRAVANNAWRSKFLLVRVINEDPRHSDHRPIIVEPGAKEKVQWRKRVEMMRKFEARWLEEEECGARVEEAWEQALTGDDVSLMEIQSRVLQELWVWDRGAWGSPKVD